MVGEESIVKFYLSLLVSYPGHLSALKASQALNYKSPSSNSGGADKLKKQIKDIRKALVTAAEHSTAMPMQVRHQLCSGYSHICK